MQTKKANIKHKTNILIVDDEESWRNAIKVLFDLNEFDILEAETGEEAINVFKSKEPDIILLDLILPDMDGIEVLKQMKSHRDIPVMVISSKDRKEDYDLASDMGADDYIQKSARIEAPLLFKLKQLLNKKKPSVEVQMFIKGNLTLNFANKIVFVNNVRIPLTKIEYNILELFARNPNKLLDIETIKKEIWDVQYELDDSYVRKYIHNIREKIWEDAYNPKIIVTEHTRGYILEV